MNDRIAVGLVTDVFHGEGAVDRLVGRLREVQEAGAEVAVLPELPLDPWVASTKRAREEDAEDEAGPRWSALSESARQTGVAVLGGAIVRDPATRARHNTAFLMDATGTELARYRKVHLPEEEGFWETSHYRPGTDPPSVIDFLGFPLGVQICSDVNRTEGGQLLAAGGALAILAPRATPAETYPRWKLVLRALAVTCAAYVISVNRPAEPGTLVGEASLAIGPEGEILSETTDPISVMVLDAERVREARARYPGYLPYWPDVYARGWRRLQDQEGS